MRDIYGIKQDSNPGRKLTASFNGKIFARYPVVTPIVEIGDSLADFIEKYAVPYAVDNEIICISAKVVSICNSYVIHQSEVPISLLARLIVKFVKKWPGDIGYSHPRKMQVAINQVGYPRIVLALALGTIFKLLGRPGYFYKIAGNNINAIDGFNPVSKPPMNEYAILPPKDGNKLCDNLENKFNRAFVILDGNNIDNNILGMSKEIRALYSTSDFMKIVEGNPQGQEDDGQVTPVLVVKEVI